MKKKTSNGFINYSFFTSNFQEIFNNKVKDFNNKQEQFPALLRKSRWKQNF